MKFRKAAGEMLVLAAGLLGGALGAAGQTVPVSAYRFAASTAPYANLASSNGLVPDIQQDNNDSRPLSIGFSFPYAGGLYTQFSVSSEGWLSLSGYVNGSNDLTTPSTVLAPFWDDLNGNFGQAAYGVAGTAPNRVLVMQWDQWRWPNNAYANVVGAPPVTTISFQVKLYETTGVIQYCYQQEAGVPYPLTNLGASIGLAGGGRFLSLSDASGAPGVSSAVSTNTITQRPATGQVYTFTPPPVCPALSAPTIGVTSATTATVSFGTGSGASGYVVEYTTVSAGSFNTRTVTVAASPALLTGLAPNTTYFVTVVAQCTNGTTTVASPAVYFSTPAAPNPAATWTGASSTAWATAANWNPAGVPVLTTDVTVPAVPNQPVVNGPQTCGTLTLQAGTTLTLAPALGAAPATVLSTGGAVLWAAGSAVVQGPGTTLALGGDLVNNGATLALDPGSTVAFDRIRQHTLSGTSPTALQNLTLGLNTACHLDLNARLSVQRLLMARPIGINLLVVRPAGSFRLRSNAAGTAQFVNNASLLVAGPVTVERTLDGTGGSLGGSGARLVASALNEATVAGLATPGFGPVVNPAYNASPTPAAVLPAPTVLGYEQGRISTNAGALADFEQGFYSPDALADTLRPGLGYRLAAAPGTATLALTGDLQVDDVLVSGLTRATLPQSGYHLLGNPYAATLDWDGVLATPGTAGLERAVYTYQPSGPASGTYQAYVNGVGTGRYLVPGQAFFVRVAAANRPATVKFAATGRYPAYYDPAAPPAAPANLRPLVRLTLAAPTGPTDEATVYFQTGATAGFDRLFDAYKLPTGGVPYVAFAGTAPLAISGLPALTGANVSLPLDVRVPATGTYTLTGAPLRNLPAGTYAYLRDAQTGRAVDLNVQPAYAFTMNAAFAGSRFTLLLTRTVLATAPAALAQQIVLYPNPARGTAQLELPAALHGQEVRATVLNALGQAVWTQALPAGSGPRLLPLAGLAPGAYTVQLHTAQGTVAKRLLLE